MWTGAGTPPDIEQAVPFRSLQTRIPQSVSALDRFVPDEANAWSRKATHIAIKHVDRQQTSFTSEALFLSFLLPNVHSHAATACGILRPQGADREA